MIAGSAGRNSLHGAGVRSGFVVQVLETCAQKVLALLPAVYGRGPKPHAPITSVDVRMRVHLFMATAMPGVSSRRLIRKGSIHNSIMNKHCTNMYTA